MRFPYVNACAPSCVSWLAHSAGLSAHCQLHENIEAGVMTQTDVPWYFGNGEIKAILPYLTVAFPLGMHMMKAIDPPHTADSAEVEYNARILLILLMLARRVIKTQ
jgi:hypothetical protein